MKGRTSRMVYHGAVLGVAIGIFIGAVLFLSALFNINIFDNLTLLFHEPVEYGEWEIIEEINGVEHIYSSANGDNPKEVLSPVVYWMEFRGGMSVILVIFVGIFAYLIGRTVVSSILRMKKKTQKVVTEVRNHTLGDYLSDTVSEYVETCKENFEENRSGIDRSVSIFGRKFEKGDRKSIIALVLFIVLFLGAIFFFIFWNFR